MLPALTALMMNITNETAFKLIDKIDKYLSKNISHDEIINYAWELADQSPKEPDVTEQVFWSSVFSIIHLADKQHWDDGCTQKELGELLSQLKVVYS